MTAIIGILNKRGVAIAADSAVTITQQRNQKIYNSGNKMLRLSSNNTISVMIAGNACFFDTPWDIVIRRYRQKREGVSFSTLEACIEDFFSYVPTEHLFLPEKAGKDYLDSKLRTYWDQLTQEIPSLDINDGDTIEANTEEVLNAFHNCLNRDLEYFSGLDKMPMLKDYSFERFVEFAGKVIDKFLAEQTIEEDGIPFDFLSDFNEDEYRCQQLYTPEILRQIKADLVKCFYHYVGSNIEDDFSTSLIFAGFGKDEEYPVLIRANVDGGFDSKVCYRINERDIFKISDEMPVAICSFAQDDIIKSLIDGIHPSYYARCKDEILQSYEYFLKKISERATIDFEDFKKLSILLSRVKYNDLVKQERHVLGKLRDAEIDTWRTALLDYDLQSMARLAENLIQMTGFERHITFSQEGVGGPIDLAIITKNNGFTWLNRKSWYHHRDVGGRYGKFGV